MLSGTERMKIWGIGEHFGGVVEEGTCCNPYIPTTKQLKEKALNALHYAGFSVESVSRNEANCIIRVYRNACMRLPGQKRASWMYGIDAYVKNLGYFRCEPVGQKFDLSCHEVKNYIGGKQSKVGLYAPCFQDFFLKVQ